MIQYKTSANQIINLFKTDFKSLDGGQHSLKFFLEDYGNNFVKIRIPLRRKTKNHLKAQR